MFSDAAARQQLPVAGVAGRQHAVEHVDAAGHRFHQIVGHPGSHQIARLVPRQQIRRAIDDVVHDVDRLADAEPANGVALEADRPRLLGALRPQIRVDAALDDPELRLTRVGRADLDLAGGHVEKSCRDPVQPSAPFARARRAPDRASRDTQVHSSSTIAMSDPSRAWMSTADSGVSR